MVPKNLERDFITWKGTYYRNTKINHLAITKIK